MKLAPEGRIFFLRSGAFEARLMTEPCLMAIRHRLCCGEWKRMALKGGLPAETAGYSSPKAGFGFVSE
jgi:hypothetical protein